MQHGPGQHFPEPWVRQCLSARLGLDSAFQMGLGLDSAFWVGLLVSRWTASVHPSILCELVTADLQMRTLLTNTSV